MQCKENLMKKNISFGAAVLAFTVVASVTLAGRVPSAVAQLSGLLRQGLTMTMSTNANGRTSTSTHYFSGNASKSVTSEGQDSIVRFDQQKMISIDNKKKTYSEMTFQEMQAAIDAAAKGLGELQGDPEAMAAMKKMMGGGNSGPLTVTKQGPGETIAGYATEKYLVTGPLQMEIWAAPELKAPTAYYDAMKVRLPANPILDMGKMFDAFKQVNGWPVKYIFTMNMMGRTMTTTTEATSIQKGPIPASTFEVPAGYKQEKLSK
jgi:hypothetical protein